nr:zinc finger BED domain-containing protein RICESLEEPER 2-like [Ipomoea batatas]
MSFFGFESSWLAPRDASKLSSRTELRLTLGSTTSIASSVCSSVLGSSSSRGSSPESLELEDSVDSLPDSGMSTGNSFVPQNLHTLNSVVGESNETINEVNVQAEGVERVGLHLDGHDTPLNEETESQQEFQTNKRKETSGVWVDFQVVNVAGIQKVECIHCHHRFAFNKMGTTTSYKRHQDKCAMRKKNVQVVDNETKLNFLPSDGVSSSIPPLHHGRVDMEVVREFIANWIMMHEHPFTLVKEAGFNVLMKRIMPEWKRISRSTIKSDCLKVYEI